MAMVMFRVVPAPTFERMSKSRAQLDVGQAHAGPEAQLPHPVRGGGKARFHGLVDVRDALAAVPDLDADELGFQQDVHPAFLRV